MVRKGPTREANNNQVESTETSMRHMRARVSAASDNEPEYFEEKRNLEDLWLQAFSVGTEWHMMDSVYRFNWNFTNLENALEEGGELYGRRVYLFGCSEMPTVSIMGEVKFMCVPVVVAVVSPFPPSDKIGVSSVQREAEEIVPMKQMKMDWIPYVPLRQRDRMMERLNSDIFIMTCTQRKAALQHLKLERIKKYDYCLPYFNNPLREVEFGTVVEISFGEPNPVIIDFNWEEENLEEVTNELIADREIPEDQQQAFKDFVTKKVSEAQNDIQRAVEFREQAIEEMSEETRAGYENMRFYKFYPVQSSETPSILNRSPFINRYYGKAHEVR